MMVLGVQESRGAGVRKAKVHKVGNKVGEIANRKWTDPNGGCEPLDWEHRGCEPLGWELKAGSWELRAGTQTEGVNLWCGFLGGGLEP